jgi:UMF1 family MFS transporter
VGDAEDLRSYPLSLFFLIAFLVYNDGIQTVITMASVYADQQLGLGQDVQLQTILLVQFLAFGGALLLGRLAKQFGAWKTVLLQPGAVDVWSSGGVLPPARLGDEPAPTRPLFMLLGVSSASCSAAARRCPRRCSASSSRRARRASTSACTRSATRAPAGSARCCSDWPTS